MADNGRTEPFENVISLVAGPIAAVIRQADQLRRGADELLRGVENFNATMENLNETASRVNRLLNDFEEPIRAMLPQLTRTVKLAEELSNRLAGPLDQVAPGLARLADTLNSPVLSSMPRDLGQFMEIINDLGRRMSPLAQLAEQAGGMFGLRIPGLSPRPAPPPPAPPTLHPRSGSEARPEPDEAPESPFRSRAARSAGPTRSARTASAKKSAAQTSSPKKSAAKKSATPARR